MNFSEHKKTAKEYKIGGGDYWKPELGENRVRILSGYEVYGFHWDNKIRKGGICIGKDNGCEWCAQGNKPAAKFLMWILDRKDEDTLKIMQVGYTVVQQLGELQESPDWTFEGIPNYDIVIKKTGKDLETKYFVTPTPTKSELTVDELAVVGDLKPLTGIISKMKEKAGGSPEVIQVEDDGLTPPPTSEDEVVPF